MTMQLFDEVVGDVPPSTVDVKAIARREKRRRVAWRTSGLAMAAVALSATVTVGLTTVGGTDVSSPPVADGAGPSAAPDTRFTLVSDNAESIQATAQRLSKALDAALKKAAPGADWIFEPDRPGETGPDSQPPTVAYKAKPGASKSREMFAGGSGVRNDGRKGSLHFLIFNSVSLLQDGSTHTTVVECGAAMRDCVEGTTPTGAKTVIRTAADGDALGYSVLVELPDGRILQLGQSNDYGPDGAGPAQPAAPLTAEQTLAVAVGLASQIKA